MKTSISTCYIVITSCSICFVTQGFGWPCRLRALNQTFIQVRTAFRFLLLTTRLEGASVIYGYIRVASCAIFKVVPNFGTDRAISKVIHL